MKANEGVVVVVGRLLNSLVLPEAEFKLGLVEIAIAYLPVIYKERCLPTFCDKDLKNILVEHIPC